MEHEGHRDRLRQRFVDEGLEHFGDEKVLEMLLFYAIPRRDTAPLADALLAQFGSLPGVLEATPEVLSGVPGISEATAVYLNFIMSMYRYYFVRKHDRRYALDTVEKCGEFLMPRFLGLREEVVYAVCLDAQCHLKGCRMLGEGSVNSANVPIRRIMEFALTCKASSVVLAHNHPAGVALPSGQDIDATKRVAEALDGVGIILADHLVVTGNEYTSMAESGILCGVSSLLMGKALKNNRKKTKK